MFLESYCTGCNPQAGWDTGLACLHRCLLTLPSARIEWPDELRIWSFCFKISLDVSMVWICPCRINRMLILKIHTAKDASALQGKFLLRREGCVIDTYVNAPCSWRESSIGQDLYSRLLNLPCWVGKWKPKIKFCKGSPLTDRWISKQDTTHSCDLNEIRGNESLYCFEGSGSVLGCEDWSRALCLSSACMRLLEHESRSTCLIFNAPALIESYVLNQAWFCKFAELDFTECFGQCISKH